LNAPHCLHASIETSFLLLLLEGVAVFFVIFSGDALVFFAGAAFLAGAALAFAEDRVERAMASRS